MSFVGAQAGRLQPPWLLRAALTTLFLTMGAAMWRNLRYHLYVHSLHTRQYATANLKRERSERDLVEQHPTVDATTGQLLDVSSYLADFQQHEKAIEEEIGALPLRLVLFVCAYHPDRPSLAQAMEKLEPIHVSKRSVK